MNNIMLRHQERNGLPHKLVHNDHVGIFYARPFGVFSRGQNPGNAESHNGKPFPGQEADRYCPPKNKCYEASHCSRRYRRVAHAKQGTKHPVPERHVLVQTPHSITPFKKVRAKQNTVACRDPIPTTIFLFSCCMVPELPSGNRRGGFAQFPDMPIQRFIEVSPQKEPDCRLHGLIHQWPKTTVMAGKMGEE